MWDKGLPSFFYMWISIFSAPFIFEKSIRPPLNCVGTIVKCQLTLNMRVCFNSVQLLSRVRLFLTPQTAARQPSLSITNSRSLLKLTSIESVMPSNHLILCCPLLLLLQSFPASGSFPMSQFFASGGQSIGAPASASVIPVNIPDWFPLGLRVCFWTLTSIPLIVSQNSH